MGFTVSLSLSIYIYIERERESIYIYRGRERDTVRLSRYLFCWGFCFVGDINMLGISICWGFQFVGYFNMLGISIWYSVICDKVDSDKNAIITSAVHSHVVFSYIIYILYRHLKEAQHIYQPLTEKLHSLGW